MWEINYIVTRLVSCHHSTLPVILSAILDPETAVVTEDEDCPADVNGTGPKNIVNRLSTKSIHIEQSNEARMRYSIEIAAALAEAIGPKIKVCIAPVFEGSDAWACPFKSLGYIAMAIPLLALAWIATIPCVVKGLLFRVKHCRRGNNNPCIELMMRSAYEQNRVGMNVQTLMEHDNERPSTKPTLTPLFQIIVVARKLAFCTSNRTWN
jgi:hypothetical protein